MKDKCEEESDEKISRHVKRPEKECNVPEVPEMWNELEQKFDDIANIHFGRSIS
jgi:hypothetical protein